jgi:hypothetical protein
MRFDRHDDRFVWISQRLYVTNETVADHVHGGRDELLTVCEWHVTDATRPAFEVLEGLTVTKDANADDDSVLGSSGAHQLKFEALCRGHTDRRSA